MDRKNHAAVRLIQSAVGLTISRWAGLGCRRPALAAEQQTGEALPDVVEWALRKLRIALCGKQR